MTCNGLVDTSDKVGVIGYHAGHMPLWSFVRLMLLTRAGLRVRALVSSVGADRDNPLDYLHALSESVRAAMEYLPGVTDLKPRRSRSAAGHGVCQDQAQVLISAGRLVGIPMRYVGGYLMMNDRIEQDAGHGWAEAHIDGLGWVGFDVSNGIKTL